MNPVLLSLLRSAPLEDFENKYSSNDQIIEQYIELLLKREQTRQSLPLEVSEQLSIMSRLAAEMVEFDISAEDIDFIKAMLEDIVGDQFSKYLNRYEMMSDVSENKPTELVCQMPESVSTTLSSNLWEFPIDKTFEIQVRTIFSEGWHEVEHDLRYKNKSDWADHMDLSRNLNGILATLETCDWAIINVLDRLAYQKYKNQDWNAMMRNHLRMHLENAPLSSAIVDIFNNDNSLAKEFFRVDRKVILLQLSSNKMFMLPKRLDNIVYFANEFIVHDPRITALIPQRLKERLELTLASIQT